MRWPHNEKFLSLTLDDCCDPAEELINLHSVCKAAKNFSEINGFLIGSIIKFQKASVLLPLTKTNTW